jgi:hypothetical protein
MYFDVLQSTVLLLLQAIIPFTATFLSCEALSRPGQFRKILIRPIAMYSIIRCLRKPCEAISAYPVAPVLVAIRLVSNRDIESQQFNRMSSIDIALPKEPAFYSLL